MECIILFFRLAKEGAILSKYNGFTLIEVLIASSILMMMITTFVPIFSLLKNEQTVLSDRRTIAFRLHDELQYYLWDKTATMPASFMETIQFRSVAFEFTKNDDLVKGCAKWKNVKKIGEVTCLYGYPQK